MAVEELGVPSALPRPTPRARSDISARFARGLSRVLAADRPASGEFALALAMVFLLGRYPLLFARLRASALFETPVEPLWQDDALILAAFRICVAVLVVLALRTVRITSVLRLPALLAVLVIVWVSVAWSVEPDVTLERATLFIGTAIAGLYIGDRFSVGEQVRIVAGVAAVGATLSILAFAIWPELSFTTNFEAGVSGVYVNRNHLALVLSYGVLATGVLLLMSRRLWRIALAGLMSVEVLLLWLTGSRTGPVGLAVAVAVACLVAVVRPWGARLLKGWAGALACTGVIVMVGGFVQWYWTRILETLGRGPELTRRTELWEITRWFSRLRPWEGWGFEAIWMDPIAAAEVTATFRRYPYTAHNGYYEFLLGTGRIGLGLLLAFLAIVAWRAFRFAWTQKSVLSLWPIAFVTFVVVVNFSESLFVSAEAIWMLTVATAVAVTSPRTERS